MELTVLNGIRGIAVNLQRDNSARHCRASVEGYAYTVAFLPLNTERAVLAPGGSLFYRVPGIGMKSVQVGNYEEIMAAAGVRLEGPQTGIRGSGTLDERSMAVTLTSGKIILHESPPDKLTCQKNTVKEAAISMNSLITDCLKSGNDLVNSLRSITQKQAAIITGHAATIAEMRKQIEQLEKLVNEKQSARTTAVSLPEPIEDHGPISRAWTDRGGLCTGGLASPGNPFSRKRSS